MMPEQQQRILGYFIEEAKDHLNTIEQGLLNLQATIQDPDMVSEVFRAAHSVKGGAAMLSLGSIQQTSHRLEDYFKVLKETPTTQVDRDLETMFLQVFDALQALLEELQGPFGLTEAKAQEVMADVEPVFGQLESHLNELVAAAPAVAPAAPKVAATATAQSRPAMTISSEDSALKLVFSSDVPGHLREMLTLFKQADTAASRSALQACCEALKQVGEQFDLSRWCDLTAASRQAVGNPEQTYRSLAPVVIKELKRAQEQVLSGQAAAIAVSAELESLLPMPVEVDAAVGDIDSLLDDALATTEDADLTDLFAAESESATGAEADLDWLETSTDELDEAASGDDLTDSFSAFSADRSATAPPREPTVGAAELNSLADLFEGEVSELDSPWEEISENEAAIADTPGPDLELDSDFSDLLDGSLDDESPDDDNDLADLFGDTEAFTSPESSPPAATASDVTDDSDLDDLLNLADTSAESTEAAAIDSRDDGLDALLDGFESEDSDVATTDEFNLDDAAEDVAAGSDDLDFDLDSSVDDDLDFDLDLEASTASSNADDFADLDLEESPTSNTADDDFGELFDAETADAVTPADLTGSDESSQADAAAALTTAATSSEADFGAIEDPWSFEDATAEAEDEASALDALDELWTGQEGATAESSDDAELDFSDFPEPATDEEPTATVTEAAAPLDELDLSSADTETSEDDFGDLFDDADGADALDLTSSETADGDRAEDSFALGEADLDPEALDTSAEAADADFDALLDDADREDAEATDDFGDLFDAGAEDTDAAADNDLDFLAETDRETAAIAPDDDFADLALGDDAATDADALFGEGETAASTDDDMADLFSDDADLTDDSALFETEDAAATTEDTDLDDLLDGAPAAPVETDSELAETVNDDATGLDLTFADDGDEDLSLDSGDDLAALSASESATGMTTETDGVEADDLFADDSTEAMADEAIAGADTDDFFSTDEEPPATSASAAATDDIDDFFSTPELPTETVAAESPTVAAAASEPAADVDFTDEDSTTEAGEADLDLGFTAEDSTTEAREADLDFDFTDEDLTTEAGEADLDFDFTDEDATTEAGEADLDFDFTDEDLTTEAGEADLDFDFTDEDATTEAGEADLDLGFTAEDSTTEAAGEADLDFDFTDEDSTTEAGETDLDLGFTAEDSTTEAGEADLDFDFTDEDSTTEAGETDLDLDFTAEDSTTEAGEADLDFDFTDEDSTTEAGETDLDLDFTAEDSTTEAGEADLDFDFADGETTNAADDIDFADNSLDFDAPPEDTAAGEAELDFDLAAADADATSDADLDLDFADATGLDDSATAEAALGDDLDDLFDEEAADESAVDGFNFADAEMSFEGGENEGGAAAGEFDGDLDSLLDEADSTAANNGVAAESLLVDDEADDEAIADLDLDLSDTASIDFGETAEDAADEAAFDDLDALLDEPETVEETADVAGATATTADDFDELDSLLGDAPAADEASAAGDEGDVDFDELDALIGDDNVSSAAAPVAVDNGLGDDFGDLEKLLEEADQTLGGSSSSMRSAGPGRSSRRVGGIVDQTMRVSVKHLDNLNNLVGELVVNRNSLEQDQDRFRQFLDNLLFQVQQLNDVGQRMRDLYERSLLESSLLASRQAFQTGGTRLTQSSGSNGDSHATGASFDALEMDRFTGFHTLTQEMIELIVRVRESSSDIAYTVESTDQIARQFRQVTTQLQEGLNKARMVPFAQTADRLPRAVRDISIKCGKEARLVVEGRDTLIDKMLLERLYDPMTHLVNNAITHGVESPEERAALGKPREGKITVRAFYQGNQTVIYIEDDGAGINPDVLKRKAIQKGLLTQAEADNMNQLETYELIFRHGFSTRDQADDFAGRGVGMDVVRTALSEIRGSITIDSELGKGTSFTIRLPLTLSISKALSCLNNQARIAFPMDGVEDMFDVPRDRVQADEKGQSYIQWRDMSLTFQPLSDLLQFNRALGRGRVYGGSQDDDMVSIVVLRNANTYIGIQVDRVLGEQEIVIKQIEGPVPKPMGIAGATVLGDGRVMPIGDVLELIDIAQGRVRREAGSSLWSQVDLPPEDEEPAKAEPTVLIVDDSITVRELLSMSFNKVGYRVEQARDGQEAWEKMRSGLPCDLVFCDIEMPRMDGLELLSRMQKDSLLKNIPIAMLTSRGADRHRQMAVDLGASGYFTKPYLEEALLEAAQRMLKGEVLLNQMVEEAE